MVGRASGTVRRRTERAGEAAENRPAARLPDAEAAEPTIEDAGRLGWLETRLRVSLGGNERIGADPFRRHPSRARGR